MQAPVAQVSGPLQKIPSLHAVRFCGVHVPGDVPLQVWQSVVTPPPHALVQHTLSTHVRGGPVWRHIWLRVHGSPMSESPSQRCVVRLQKKLAVQSVSALQAPWQAVPLHGVVGPHATGFCGGQVPLLQVTAGIDAALGIEPEHDGAAPHGVVFGMFVLQTPP